MKEKYITPHYSLSSFTCPHCGAHSQMDLSVISIQDGEAYTTEFPESTSYIYIAVCYSCKKKDIVGRRPIHIPRTAIPTAM